MATKPIALGLALGTGREAWEEGTGGRKHPGEAGIGRDGMFGAWADFRGGKMACASLLKVISVQTSPMT